MAVHAMGGLGSEVFSCSASFFVSLLSWTSLLRELLMLFCSFFVLSQVLVSTLSIASLLFSIMFSFVSMMNPLPLSYGLAVMSWRFLNVARPFLWQ